MTDLKEQAKKIIAKGKVLNDPELIRMGLDMLESIPVSDEQEESPSVEVKDVKVSSSSSFMDQFRTDNKTQVDTRYGKKIAVSVVGRVNTFQDNKTEAVELIGKTPNFTPAPRNRKTPLVEAVCTICGKKETVNEIFTQGKEFYRCESCLLKGKS